ncbi:hypothetical protein ACWEV4_33200 [Streptomyces sp. NPDC003860]
MTTRGIRTWGPGARTLARAALAGLVGAVVGIAAYSISQTGGQLRSVVVGGLAGIAIVLGAEFHRRSAQLTEVQLTLPGSVMVFTANIDMRQAALRMFFQAATRVATRPLDGDSGNLREALTSLKTLFDLYREPLESGVAPPPPAKGDSVHALVLDILNFELAPFLANWHPRLTAWEAAHGGRGGRGRLAGERRVPRGSRGSPATSSPLRHRARGDRRAPGPEAAPAPVRLARKRPDPTGAPSAAGRGLLTNCPGASRGGRPRMAQDEGATITLSHTSEGRRPRTEANGTPRHVFCGSATGPLTSRPGMTVSPLCERRVMPGSVT